MSLYYESHGAGPPVVFAHGVAGNTLIWFQQIPHFSRQFRVITYDQRGFGRSVCPPSEIDIRYLGSDLRALLDALDIERAAIVGHDMGGLGGLRLALEHPERVSALVICNSAGGVISERILRSAAAALSDLTRSGPQDGIVLSPEFERENPYATFLQHQIYGLSEPFDAGLLASAVEARVQPGELAGFSTPTLVVTGSQDRLFPAEAVHEAAGLIPGAKIVDFEETGHLPFFERPKRFNRLVGEFLALHPAS